MGGASGPLGSKVPAGVCFLGIVGTGNNHTSTDTSKSSGSAFPGIRLDLPESSGLCYGGVVTMPLACLVYSPCSSLGTRERLQLSPPRTNMGNQQSQEVETVSCSLVLRPVTESPPSFCKCCPWAWSNFSPVIQSERWGTSGTALGFSQRPPISLTLTRLRFRSSGRGQSTHLAAAGT